MNKNIDKIFKIISIITIIISIFFIIKDSIMGTVLLFAGIWINPITRKILQKINLYFYNNTMIIGFVILVLLSVGLYYIEKNADDGTHKHIASDWIYNAENNYEYKECTMCKKILEKNIPNLEYTTMQPTQNTNDNYLPTVEPIKEDEESEEIIP